MPTQHDFRAAAGALRRLAVQAGASAIAVNDAYGDLGLLGGTLTAVADTAMNACFLNARSVEQAAGDAASEFDRRAEVCAEYTRQIQRWRADMAAWQHSWASYYAAVDAGSLAFAPGPAPVRPTRSPHWVEEG